MLSSAHELRDGTLARLRLTRPSDSPRVREFLETLSNPSRHRRFLSALDAVPDTVVRHFTYYEPRERLMLAATAPHEGTGALIGLADVAMLETGMAEIAVVVHDDHQGKGVGKLLTQAVAALATRRGATRLKAVMAADNKAMLRLMENLGETVKTHEGDTLIAYTQLESSSARHAA